MYKKIQGQIKEAMKTKNIETRDVLKMVIAKAQMMAKEQKCEISDDLMIQAINKEMKQLQQTKDSLAGKEDSTLYVSTIYKMDVLKGYLPTQMSESEIREYIEEELIELTSVNVSISPKIKGMLMKNIMPKLKGKADGKLINKIVEELLNK